MNRRQLLTAALALPSLARAEGFPARPVTAIVSAPPGGSSDTSMRVMAELAAPRLGQPVVVENRPGVAQTLGPTAVARARPDGYTLAILIASNIRVQMLQRLPFDTLKDFTPIVHISRFGVGVVAKTGRFPRGWAGFVAEAKRRPGALTYGSTGVNGTPHVGLAELVQRAGLDVVHVPYRGDADGMQALLGGQIDLFVGSTSIGGAVDGGQAEWLVMLGPRRLRRWPDAPTAVELGFSGVVHDAPFGLVGPAGLAPEIVRRLHDAFAPTITAPQHLALLERFAMEPDYLGPEDYAAQLRERVRREEELIARLGLTAG